MGLIKTPCTALTSSEYRLMRGCALANPENQHFARNEQILRGSVKTTVNPHEAFRADLLRRLVPSPLGLPAASESILQ